MKVTHHAWSRWQQRHPHLDMAAEFAAARRASKRLTQLLTGHREPGSVKYMVTSHDVLFVVGAGSVVVTVLSLRASRRRARAIRRRDKAKREAWVD